MLLLLLRSPLRLFFAAHEAVLLFFLISGFVLTLSLARDNLPYQVFALRRITRIWLPYVVALALAAVGAVWFNGPVSGTSGWFAETWKDAPAVALIAQHLLLVGKFEVIRLNTAFWSLVYEMRISFLFPAVLLLSRRSALIVAMACIAATLVTWLTRSSAFGAEWLITLHFAGIFAVGGWMAFRVDDLMNRWQAITGGRSVAVTAGAVILVMYAGALRPVIGPFSDWPIVAGLAWLMISALAYQPAARWLQRPLPQYLGRISYSLYLTHGTILFAGVHYLAPTIGLARVMPFYLVSAFVVAHSFNRAVEEPAIALTRRIGRRALEPDS